MSKIFVILKKMFNNFFKKKEKAYLKLKFSFIM